MLYLGIDQHRKQLTVNIRQENGDVLLKRQVSTEWDRVRQFFDDLSEQARAEGGFVAVVEVCGFNHWLMKMLDEYGCREAVLIQPDQRSRKKTDRRDAAELSRTLWVNRERLIAGKNVHGVKRIVPPTPDEEADRQLTAFRDRTGKLCTRVINKVHRILLKHNLQQECPTKGIKTKKARRWFRELDLDEIDWVIVGGESGLRARPMEIGWVRNIREQCLTRDVPFFFKQWGGVNKKKTGRLLDNRLYNEMPPLPDFPDPSAQISFGL